MSREIDIKALVSHLVRGDGADKCRICMGDTSEGQVYLGDTVMMDGERPVTLAELLEVITGVEVPEEVGLPRGLCSFCSGTAIDAANFSLLCRRADSRWKATLQLLCSLPVEVADGTTALYALLQDDQMTITTDVSKTAKSDLDDPDGEPRTPRKRNSLRRRYKITHCKCPKCGKKFNCAEKLAKHLKDSTDLTRACHICAYITRKDNLIEHLKRAHGVSPFVCKKCPALFSSRLKFLRHKNAGHGKGVCVCGDCGRSFRTRQAFNAHQSVHIAKACPGCDKLFRNRQCYIYHVRTCCDLDKTRQDAFKTKSRITIEVQNKVSEERIKVGLRGSTQDKCICDYCNKTFASKRFVAAHIQIVHTKNTHAPCPYCGKLLAAAHMPTHMKTHDQTALSLQCEYCNLVLKTKVGFVQHLRLHTGEKPYKCEHCGEMFSSSSRRSAHKRIHKPEGLLRHACELCPARFDVPFKLKRHMVTVHSEEAEKHLHFECPECHIKFSSCRGLIHHSRKHQTAIRMPAKSASVTRKWFNIDREEGIDEL